jgi:hypothetical protein
MTGEERLKNDDEGHPVDIQLRTWKSKIGSAKFDPITRRRIWN